MKGTSPSRVTRAAAGYGIQVPRWKARNPINSFVFVEREVKTIVTICIDFAKKVFAVHGVDTTGKAVQVRPKVAHGKLLEIFAAAPHCLIGTAACSGAHHWPREEFWDIVSDPNLPSGPHASVALHRLHRVSLDEAAGVIHVRSASRLGYGDRGVNRARVEAIRTAFMASPAGLPAGAGAAR